MRNKRAGNRPLRGMVRCNGIGPGPRPTGGSMTANDVEVYREEFETEGEAIAFTEGLDFMDSDHVSWDAPYIENDDKWVVEVRKFA